MLQTVEDQEKEQAFEKSENQSVISSQNSALMTEESNLEKEFTELESSMSSSRTTVASSSGHIFLDPKDDLEQNVEEFDKVEEVLNEDIEKESDVEQSDENTNRMIEDAIREEKRSEASSSSKSYELLKLESLPTSGHTSGDDVEVITNTSSDIEIISSPVLSENGRRVHQQNQQLIQSKVNAGSPRKERLRKNPSGKGKSFRTMKLLLLELVLLGI